MRIFYCVVVLVICCAFAQAQEWRDNAKVAAAFAGISGGGTFVLYDVEAGTFVGYNKDRAAKRYIPASTFKIANTLIGLATGVVSSVDEILPFAGGPQMMKDWERDMSLRDAIAISNVPIYQELARRVGVERMRVAVAGLNYGNADVGGSVDTFWLRGPLEISALEQCLFLADLATGRLPLPQQAQKEAQDIVLLKKKGDWSLYGKTGAASGVGWWVGWVNKGGKVYSFALNMDMADYRRDGPLRVEIGRTCLRTLGLYQ